MIMAAETEGPQGRIVRVLLPPGAWVGSQQPGAGCWVQGARWPRCGGVCGQRHRLHSCTACILLLHRHVQQACRPGAGLQAGAAAAWLRSSSAPAGALCPPATPTLCGRQAGGRGCTAWCCAHRALHTAHSTAPAMPSPPPSPLLPQLAPSRAMSRFWTARRHPRPFPRRSAASGGRWLLVRRWSCGRGTPPWEGRSWSRRRGASPWRQTSPTAPASTDCHSCPLL